MYQIESIKEIKSCSICGEEECEELITFVNENHQRKRIKIRTCEYEFDSLEEILNYVNEQ